ncbi:MAG: nucleotidyltransferase domain-containing protein [Wenzhouxiangella sp.]|nr:MAG: nucleotidyltransferase domain-containing protein [Wenzhouxiangella sp.]
MVNLAQTIEQIVAALPRPQAVYLFGSAAIDEALPDSDIDIAVLLPPDEARRVGNLAGSQLHLRLESGPSRDIDLINLREVSTVFQKEIVFTGKRVYCADAHAADEFEMHVLSLYQKLNAGRADIIAEGRSSGYFLQP